MGESSDHGRDLAEIESKLAEERARCCALERRLAERDEALLSVNRELDLLFYAISHDLRAPLRAVDGFSEALEEDCAGHLGDEGQEYVRRVRAAGKRMVQMIDGLLELSRLARSELQRQEVDVSALARSVVDELSRKVPGRSVQMTIQAGMAANADARLLRIALVALLENAWKFTGKQESSVIELGADEGGEGTHFFVRDDGVGFDMSFADKLFSPFQRLHAPSEFEGLGIGLAKVQRIVRLHGGRVWASAAVGEGATLSFTLCDPGA